MIELKNIDKIYEINKKEKVTALKSVDLFFKEGELIVLKGVSGSGKSTILSLIAGLSKPTKGEVLVDEKRVSKLADNFLAQFRRENIGFVFQKYNLIPNLSAFENVILPLVPNNPDTQTVEKKVKKVLDTFGILDKKDIEVKNLSGGEQQRVAIARAMINDPKIIIADEPTANLDLKLSQQFCDILKSLKDENKTIIVATHDPIFFDLDFVDRIIEVQNGKVL